MFSMAATGLTVFLFFLLTLAGPAQSEPVYTINPQQIPWYFYLVLLPTGAWAAQKFAPWLMGLLDAEFKSRRENAAKRASHQEDRFIAAFETAARAMERSAESSIQIAAALQTLAQVRVADNLVLSRLERRIDDLRTLNRIDFPPEVDKDDR